jgi:hypothetical protein
MMPHKGCALLVGHNHAEGYFGSLKEPKAGSETRQRIQERPSRSSLFATLGKSPCPVRRIPLTIAIAARANDGSLICASDRMIEIGDMQAESPVTKIYPITRSIVALPSDEDAGLHEEILVELQLFAHDMVGVNPEDWLSVQTVVDEYIAIVERAKQKRAAAAFLAPLGLTHERFLSEQASMEPNLVSRIAEDLVRFKLPSLSVIIAGIQPGPLGHPHSRIFEIHNGDSGCLDTVGYSAIGAGARHVRAHFMLSGQSSRSTPADTIWNVFFAKKRAEVAPGVGFSTDMIIMGPNLGFSTFVHETHTDQFLSMYWDVLAAETAARQSASTRANTYVKEITQRNQAAPQAELPSDAEKPPEKPEGAAE